MQHLTRVATIRFRPTCAACCCKRKTYFRLCESPKPMVNFVRLIKKLMISFPEFLVLMLMFLGKIFGIGIFSKHLCFPLTAAEEPSTPAFKLAFAACFKRPRCCCFEEKGREIKAVWLEVESQLLNSDQRNRVRTVALAHPIVCGSHEPSSVSIDFSMH